MCGTIGRFIEQIPMMRYGKINIDMGNGKGKCKFSTPFIEYLNYEGLTLNVWLCPTSIACDQQQASQDCTRRYKLIFAKTEQLSFHIE